MSAPPINSPLMDTCGIVGHTDSAESSCRICGSGSTSTAVTGAPAARNARRARSEFPHMTSCGVPFMNTLTGSFSMISLIWSPNVSLLPAHVLSSRLHSELVDRPVGERPCERLVDEAVLIDEREPVEAAAGDRDLEVVAAARPVFHPDLARVGERVAEKRLEPVGHDHGIIVAVRAPPVSPRLVPGAGGPRARRRARRRGARRRRSCCRGSPGARASTRRRRRTCSGSRSSSSAASSARPAGEPDAADLLKRKTAGNVVEFGSIAAFGFSPLWLLAAASDISHGSRVYLAVLVDELQRAGVLTTGTRFDSVDDLLAALEGASGTTARLVDLPPLELAELRASLVELRSSADELPSPQELAALFDGLTQTAAESARPLLEVSAGMGLAFLLSARATGREHLIASYREDWKPLREEGFAGTHGGSPSRTERRSRVTSTRSDKRGRNGR